MSIHTGGGNDSLTLDRNNRLLNVSLTTGQGNDVLTVRRSNDFGGLTMSTAVGNDTISIAQSQRLTDVALKTGSGNDTTTVDRSEITSFVTHLAAGNDSCIHRRSTFHGRLVTMGGQGFDQMTSTSNTVPTDPLPRFLGFEWVG